MNESETKAAIWNLLGRFSLNRIPHYERDSIAQGFATLAGDIAEAKRHDPERALLVLQKLTEARDVLDYGRVRNLDEKRHET